MELSLAMLVKARPRAQLWAVWWEVSAGAMREGDRHRAGTGDTAHAQSGETGRASSQLEFREQPLASLVVRLVLRRAIAEAGRKPLPAAFPRCTRLTVTFALRRG